MQNILITGAAGFIGSTFATTLSKLQNVNLILIDSLDFGTIENLPIQLRSKLIKSNCLNVVELRKIIPSNCIIFHFAGISSLAECESDYLSSINNNFISTVNIFEIGIEKGMQKFIFASTSAVYENNKIFPFKEVDEVKPDLMYSFSKNLCEKLLKFRSEKLDCPPIIITRFFNVFGYNQNIFRKNPPLTGYLLDCLQKNQEAIIYNNDTEIKRDYIFIDDLMFILSLFVDQKITKTYDVINITSGNQYSVQDILNSINKISQKTLNYKFGDPKSIWFKYPNILTKIPELRIKNEVFNNLFYLKKT